MMLRRLASDDRGAAIIELALVAPMLGLLVIGVVDISNAYGRKLALEQGAQRAIEKVMQTTELDTVENTLKTEAVCQVNGMTGTTCNTSPITAANVTVTYRLECVNGTTITSTQTSTDATAFDAFTCGSTEREQKYLEVNITDKYTPMFTTYFAGYNSGDGTYHLQATAGVRTK